MASDLDVSNPMMPLQRKRPLGYKESTPREYFPGNVEEFYWPNYFEAFDLVCNGIKKHFDQHG